MSQYEQTERGKEKEVLKKISAELRAAHEQLQVQERARHQQQLQAAVPSPVGTQSGASFQDASNSSCCASTPGLDIADTRHWQVCDASDVLLHISLSCLSGHSESSRRIS